MHDFLLAKEIIDELKKITQAKKLSDIKSVSVEIGQIVMAHDGHEKHLEDISIENLNFALAGITKGTPFEKTKFHLTKIAGDNWKITSVEV